jgi:hypothetical protein
VSAASPQQDVERAIDGRQQRGRLGVGAGELESVGIRVAHRGLDVDEERRDDRVCEPGHRRAHYPHELEDRIIAEDRLGRRHPGNEIAELLPEHAVIRPRLWEPGGAHDL